MPQGRKSSRNGGRGAGKSAGDDPNYRDAEEENVGDVQVDEIDAMSGRHLRAAERDDDVGHHEADNHSKDCAPEQNTSRKETEANRGEGENGAPDQTDDEMQQAAEKRDADSGLKRGGAEKIGGVPLEEDESRDPVHEEDFGDPEVEVDEEGAGDAGENRDFDKR